MSINACLTGYLVREALAMPKHRDDQERFWEKVAKTDYCWLWTAHTNPAGYGRFGLWATGRSMILAHRFSWEIVNGPIPDGMCILHHCDNPPCVRIDHLFLGTRDDNAKDTVSKSRQSRGMERPLSKFTDEQIIAIRSDARPQQMIADEYMVAQSQISRIKNGKRWRHII